VRNVAKKKREAAALVSSNGRKESPIKLSWLPVILFNQPFIILMVIMIIASF
jgi:hypothetical protein